MPMKRSLAAGAGLLTAGGAYYYVAKSGKWGKEEFVIKGPPQWLEDAKKRRAQPVERSLGTKVVRAARAVFRAFWLVYAQVLPLCWASILHLVSHRLVSRKTLHDIFSHEFCDVMSKLHDDNPKHSWKETQRMLVEAYGSLEAVDDIFEWIEKEALHAGAIAQVHRATLRSKTESVRKVVLKVMHPSVQSEIDIDLTLIDWAIRSVSFAVPHAYWFSLRESFDEFNELMRSQLNLEDEAEHMMLFQKNFANFKDLTFPTAVRKYCRETILVESQEEGVGMKTFLKTVGDDAESQKLKRHLASIGSNAFFKMVFEDNFFHADLHPGNILVREKDGHHSLVFLDTGLVSWLSKTDQRNFVELFGAVCAGDGRLAAELIINGSSEPCENPKEFTRSMVSIVDRVNGNLKRSFKLADIQIGEVLLETMESVRKNRVKLDPNFTSLILSIIVLEGLGRSLWPEMDLFKVAVPYLLPHLALTDVKYLVPVVSAQYGLSLPSSFVHLATSTKAATAA
ncbi:putative protein kinase UbiB [Diplonema papillatum]|nr:putative protein kinase UbiB [Diplonema papillatum]